MFSFVIGDCLTTLAWQLFAVCRPIEMLRQRIGSLPYGISHSIVGSGHGKRHKAA